MRQVSVFIILIAFLLPLPSLAYSQNYIISDNELGDYSSMTLEEIKQFLDEHNSFLAYFADFYPEDNAFMTAAEIIFKTAQKFSINPKFILALLEKEQSLISIGKPAMRRLDWATGYAVCDKCRLAHPLVAQFRGFGKQVYYSINKIRNGFLADIEKNGVTKAGFGPGVVKNLSRKIKITPANKATAALYNYTPHLAGNKSLYIIWKNWFSDIKYPDGSLLQDIKTGGVYLIQDGKKRPFLSKKALTSRYNEDIIVQVVSNHLNKYPAGKPIKFINNAVLQDEKKNLYLIMDDGALPFDSLKTFKSLGFNVNDIENISSKDIASYSSGQAITATSTYASGSLLQDEATGGVYFAINGAKHPIQDKSILQSRFQNKKIIRAGNSTLSKLEKGPPIKFIDGTLIKNKSNPSVYFISGGKLRPIPSEDVFLAYSWQWKNVLSAPKEILGAYEIGPPITLDDASQSSDNTQEEDEEETQNNDDDINTQLN